MSVNIRVEEVKRPPFLTWFIPFPMNDPDRPELNIFPKKIIMARNDKVFLGPASMHCATYDPDLDTLAATDAKSSLCYLNSKDQDYWIRITHDTAKGSYTGVKFFKDDYLGEAYGIDWDMFFVQLGILSLAEQEPFLKSRSGMA